MSDDNKKLTSLLGKSSGASWGDIAGAYLSGGRKKDNRARNLFLASLFFNAKEANMQSKVLKNLKENDEQKTFALQNRAYAFEQGLKKQNQYDEVQSRGAYDYYQDEAEKAFYKVEAHRKDKSFFDDEDKGQSAKEEWKNDWSNERHNQFLESYNVDAPRLTTQETFNKPINDYFKAKKEEISNPRNVSLVHKAFGFLPGAKERDKELQIKTQEAKVIYNKALERGTNLVNAIGTLNVAELQALDKNKTTINEDNIRDLLVADYGEDISSEIRNEVITRFKNSDIKTYNNYKTITQSIIDNKFSIAASNTIKEASATYRANRNIATTNPEITDIGELNYVRRQLGVTDTTADVLVSSQELAEIVADIRNLKGTERKNYIKNKMPEFAESIVNRIAGIRNPNDLQEEYRLTYLIDLSNQITSRAASTDINRTRINRDFVLTLPKEINSQISKETKTFLNEIEYDYNSYPQDESQISKEIKMLQEQQFRRNSTDVFESLMTYAFNQTTVLPEANKVPEAFRKKNINIDTPFR